MGSGSNDSQPRFPSHLSVQSFVLCHTTPNSISVCKIIEFTLPPAALEDSDEPEMWLSLIVSNKLAFGSHLFVSAQAANKSIVLPSQQEVCSTAQKEIVKDCDVPTLHTVIDWTKEEVIVHLTNEDKNSSASLSMCLKYEDTGDCIYHKWDQKDNISIPFHSVTPCLCIQAWWMKTDALRVNSCPFSDLKEFFNNTWKNISLLVEPVQSNGGDTVLTWNLSTPCRVEAELWLCEKMVEGALQSCKEKKGSRVHLRKDQDSEWSVSSRGHLGKGEFNQIFPHPMLCVAAKIYRMSGELAIQCPFAAPRRNWSLLVLVTLLLICLVVFLASVLHGSFKGDANRGHMVLLFPPDTEPALPGLVYRLGSMLSAAGFSVSGDLWSRGELCTLGAVPWLHAQLENVQRRGGKAVLIVTRTAWELAESWPQDAGRTRPFSYPYPDVFVAALSCILADQLQGQAGRRFTLVQFDTLPPTAPANGHPFPELFQGLSLYSLPSQHLDFVMELVAPCGWAGSWLGRLQGRLWVWVLGLYKARGLHRHWLSRHFQGGTRSLQGTLWETAPLRPSPSA
ncbi:interleukin-17 receptor C isoform X2 [Brienomyrus brachyistius]|nr:interleukin-17 receptor C isoform X2 [Brienomyrus brachyistius]